jgi:hypothetical protein
MTLSHTLQLPQSPAQAESHVFDHPHANNHVGLLRPVSVLRDSGEGNADNAVFMEKLGEEIDMQRLYPVVEDNDPIAVMADFTYRSGHVTSLRVTMDGLNSLRIAV